MRLHEITDASEYLLTGSQADQVIDALLQAVGNIPQNLMTSQLPAACPEPHLRCCSYFGTV